MFSEGTMTRMLKNRALGKLLAMAVVIFLLQIPIHSIEELVAERSGRQQEVARELKAKWGPDLKVRGPMLVVPTRQGDGYQYYIAKDLAVDVAAAASKRYRSIFGLPTFQADLKVTGHFEIPKDVYRSKTRASDFGDSSDPDEAMWDQASWVMMVGPDERQPNQGVLAMAGREEVRLTLANSGFGISSTLLHGPAGPLRDQAGKTVPFSASFSAVGSESIHVAPLADSAVLGMKSNWPHPSPNADHLGGSP